MKILLMAMGAPALMLALGVAIAATPTGLPNVANAAPSVALAQTMALNRIENIPEQVATARVTDLSGKVIGAVQKVEIQNGWPARVDIVLMGSEPVIRLEAASLRYDAFNNVVVTAETVAQLLARTHI